MDEIGICVIVCMLLVMIMFCMLFIMVCVVKCMVCCDELYWWLIVMFGICSGSLVVS